MKKIGITGGIGSGKSTVADIFSHLGVPVFEADAETRFLQDNNPDLRQAIIQSFGAASYSVEGKLNRKELAMQVFNNAKRLQELNAIVHPYVQRHFENWCKQFASAPFIVKEAAILFESCTDKGLDGVIVVTAPESIRIQRVMQRDGVSEDEVKKRIQNQWPEEEKVKRAQWVIHNDGIMLLLPQVIHIVEQIKKT